MRPVTDFEFERARTPEAKRARQQAILDTAARLAAEHGVREVTMSAIADAVGMHKSAILRYFETREDVFLQLAADAWSEWLGAVSALFEKPAGAAEWSEQEIAATLAGSLTERPLFCDLLAHTPLNLERNVSTERIREFKTVASGATTQVGALLCTLTPLRLEQARSVVTVATSMAGALWQMAAPTTTLRAFYESDPALAHAVVDVEPRLTDIISALIRGYAG
jgi:AcrR family transcriptional regulator